MVAAMMPRKTVMVVEDEPCIRGLLSMTLECENYRVETASDGLEALTKLERQAPDVILLDLMLPKMDGWTLIDELSENAATDKIPIIAVSAGTRYTDVGERGVQAFLSKPFDVETLLVVLEEVLR
jgi:CheY-like chemotaxis protein